ncbi:Uracil phosphoribosyltransferase [Grifola frondosa]|uniref:Uracil phosphoribosyltransferase n=1 Tax=Grifola frondosa TaxID=5627 RepID=A0A1C7LPI6_GRIFR|nr:Uracil phosphoribosyltransferase [Grifola frondosa]
MLATGGSAMKAVEVIMEHGVPEERIIFINLISSPEGLKNFCTRYPSLRVITGWIDKGLNEKAYIIPGLGDFGERRQVNRKGGSPAPPIVSWCSVGPYDTESGTL